MDINGNQFIKGNVNRYIAEMCTQCTKIVQVKHIPSGFVAMGTELNVRLFKD